MWRKGVILKLTQFRIKGKMLRWINDFLADRKIRVKVEDQVSDFQKNRKWIFQRVGTQSNFIQCYNGHTRTAMNDLMVKKGLDLSQFAVERAF